MASPPYHERNLLLDLPPELRALILNELLTATSNKWVREDKCVFYKLHPEILRVNKLLSIEGREVLRRQNTLVRIETPWPQAEEHVAVDGHVPLLMSASRLVDRCSIVSMSVQIVMADAEPRSKFLLLVKDLSVFCKFWMFSDLTYPGLNSNLSMTLTLENPRTPEPQVPKALPKSLQTRLLQPFAVIKNLQSLEIRGPRDADVEAAFRADLAVPNSSPEECLEKCFEYKKKGNEEIKRADPAAALSCYTHAFGAMHIIVNGCYRQIWADSFYDVPLTGGMYDGRDGSVVRLELRIQLVANVTLAYLNLESWHEAKFWGMRSIDMMRDNLGGAADEPRDNFPARDSWAKIYFRTALAHKGLGEMSEARALLRIAQAWLPRDEVVKKEVAACALRL